MAARVGHDASAPMTATPTAAPSKPATPLPAAPLVDSHCHIVFRNFDDDLEEVARRWREAGVTALLHACVEPSEIPAIRALADRFPEMRYSVGVHPLDTEHWVADTRDVLA
jgi:TatD DNase family protein